MRKLDAEAKIHGCIAVASDAELSSLSKEFSMLGQLGISKIFVSKHEKFSHFLPEIMAPWMHALLKEKGPAKAVSHVLASSSSAAVKNWFPRLGALLDVAPLSEVVSIESASVFTRPIYAGTI